MRSLRISKERYTWRIKLWCGGKKERGEWNEAGQFKGEIGKRSALLSTECGTKINRTELMDVGMEKGVVEERDRWKSLRGGATESLRRG